MKITTMLVTTAINFTPLGQDACEQAIASTIARYTSTKQPVTQITCVTTMKLPPLPQERPNE